jgi:hypothetical protein
VKIIVSAQTQIDCNFEIEVANFFKSHGINCGEGDIVFRIIILVLYEKGESMVTYFSDIRKYTDSIADKGSVGSKMKSVILFEGLAMKIERGGYVITEKGSITAEYIKKSTEFYARHKMMENIIKRIP